MSNIRHNHLLVMLVMIFALVSSTLVSAAAAEDINKIIKAMIIADYQLDPQQYEIEITSSQLKISEIDPVFVTYRPLTQKEPLGLFTILVTIERDDMPSLRGQIRMRIKRFAEVLVATDRITRHALLGSNNFELKRMNVTSLRQQPVRSFERIADHRSKRMLRKGDILTTGAVEPVPDIDVGEEVTITYSDHWGTITVPGRVMQTGWAGKKIRVKNKASGKIVLARVVDSKSVAVDP